MNHSWRVLSYYARTWLPLIAVVIGLIGFGWFGYGLWIERSSNRDPAPAPQATSQPQVTATEPAPTSHVGAPVPTPHGAAPPDANLDPIISQVIELSNQARQANGCNIPLTNHALLNLAAQRHSEDMIERDYFEHTSPDGKDPGDRITATGYVWSTYGENIAAGYATPAEVMGGWMNSPGHRANILNCDFREIGIGYAVRQSNAGRAEPFWTQVFATQQ